MHDDPLFPHEADAGIGTLLSRAVSDLENVARAEIALQRARIVEKVDGARSVAILAVGALILGSMALTGMVVGALLMLAAALGPVWATLIVVLVLVGAAGLLGWLALQRFKTVFGAGKAA